MFGIENLAGFIIAGILLNLTPGADTMYILGRSISNGKRAGIFSALGIAVGSLVHTVFATLGLSLILAESALAFSIVKYLGAAYLIYLGLKALMSKSATVDTAHFEGLSDTKVFLSGILTNVLNPKVALFYLAFLPQFIDPNYTYPLISFLLLGLIFTFTGTLWCIVLALSSSKFTSSLRKNPLIKLYLDRISGAVFILLGIKLAMHKLK